VKLSDSPAISIIIPHLAGVKILCDCLSSLEKQTFSNFETIVVDNASSDGSLAIALSRFPRVRSVKLKENRGFAGAANAGLNAARAGNLAFINDDVVLKPNWIENTFTALSSYPGAGAATGKLLDAGQPGHISSAGNYLLPTGFGRDRGVGEADLERFAEGGEVFWGSGAACLIRRSVFEKIGTWDEDFFSYYEDTDLGLRARMAGFTCIYVPEAVGFHIGGATGGRKPAERSALCTRNAVYTALKSFPASLLLRNLPMIVFAHLRALAYLVRLGEALRAIRIEWDVVRNLPKLWKKRKKAMATRVIGNNEINLLLHKYR